MSIIIPASAPFPLQWPPIFQILPLFISLYNIRFLVLRNDVFGPRYRIIRYVIRSVVLPVSSLTLFLSLSATSPLRPFAVLFPRMLFSFRLFVIFRFLYFPRFFVPFSRVPLFAGACHPCFPSLAHLFFNHSTRSHDGNDVYIYIYLRHETCS